MGRFFNAKPDYDVIHEIKHLKQSQITDNVEIPDFPDDGQGILESMNAEVIVEVMEEWELDNETVGEFL